MATMLDPYAPPQQSAPSTVPAIPGVDDLSMSPVLAHHQIEAQGYQSDQLRARQQAIEAERQNALRETQSGVNADIADPQLQKGWNELTPQQRQQQQVKYSPLTWADLPTIHNQAVSTVTGRPTGANIQGSEQVSGEVPGGFKFTNMQPPAQEGATTSFSALAPQEQGMAQEIANYRYPFQALSRIPGPQRVRILNAAAEVNPDFDANQYQTRQGMMKSFSSGPDADNIKSANTLVGHLDGLLTAGEQLHNRSFTPWNAVANTVQSSTGNPAQVTFKTKADAVASELAKLFKGTGGSSEKEIKEWRDNLSPNMSPDQIRASAASILDLINSRVDAIRTKWTQGMGTDKGAPGLSAEAQQILQKHGLLDSSGVPQATVTTPQAPAPQPQQQVPQVDSQQQYDALPKGAQYRDSNGRMGTKR